MSIKSKCSIASSRSSAALLIFHLEDLPIDVGGVFKFSTMIVYPSVSGFMSVSICCTYLDAPILGAYILTIVTVSS